MKLSLIATVASMCFATGVVVADEEVDVVDSKPIELTVTQMDQITAGDLTLPNGKKVFDGFENGAGIHPGLLQALFGPNQSTAEAAWEAHFNSPVITCADC